MPLFAYKAKQQDAGTVTGEVDASDVDDAIDQINRLGLLPVSVHEKGALAQSAGGLHSVKPRIIYAFTRQLISLLKSGIPILRALELLARQNRDAHFSAVINDVVANLRNGRSFSASLAEHPRVFADIYVALVRAGEESGRLRELLGSLSVYHRKQEEIAQKIRGALTYPAFMLTVGFGTVLFILSFVMPKMSVLFDGMRMTLPWPTQVVIGLSQGVRAAWPALIVLVLAGALASRFLTQMPQIRRNMRASFTGLPFVKDFVIKVDMERFSRTLGLLLESGIPILKALEISTPTIECEPLRQDMVTCQTRVSAGSSFGECLRESIHVPDIVAQLVVVGEESGELAGSLNDIAETYEQEVAEITKAATTLLEPVLILIVGLVVGFIVFAMLMPVFQMDMFAT